MAERLFLKSTDWEEDQVNRGGKFWRRMADGGPEWELSKENVQPLKKGREMDSLSAALQHSASDTAKLQSQRQ